jgi:AbiV family abortive infection protein
MTGGKRVESSASDHRLVEHNVRRLLADAKLLYERDSFRSATALTILAAEEMGKIVILSLPVDSRHKDHGRHLLSHVEKLTAFMCAVQLTIYEKIEMKTLKTLNIEDSQRGRAELAQIIQSKFGPLPEELANSTEFVRDAQVLLVNAYLAVFGSEDGLGDAMGQIGTGLANKVKQHGFYVDPSGVGDENPSGESDSENARRWIAAIEEVLQSTVMRATMAALNRQGD